VVTQRLSQHIDVLIPQQEYYNTYEDLNEEVFDEYLSYMIFPQDYHEYQD
jgi:hypothetical protein